MGDWAREWVRMSWGGGSKKSSHHDSGRDTDLVSDRKSLDRAPKISIMQTVRHAPRKG